MPPELRKAYQANDRAVMEAYGFWGRLNTESECVAELMKMCQVIGHIVISTMQKQTAMALHESHDGLILPKSPMPKARAESLDAYLTYDLLKWVRADKAALDWKLQYIDAI